jgi:hypothetical protein
VIREVLLAGVEPPEISRLTVLTIITVRKVRHRLVLRWTLTDKRAAQAAHERHLLDPAYRAAVLERIKAWRQISPTRPPTSQ